jgi:hypothetical protein
LTWSVPFPRSPSWGGILALEYALKYPQHLKGLIISNMMSSIPAYNDYAKNVLMPRMEPKVLAEVLAGQVQHGRYLHCPQGSHMSMYDDQKTYVTGLIRFLQDMEVSPAGFEPAGARPSPDAQTIRFPLTSSRPNGLPR